MHIFDILIILGAAVSIVMVFKYLKLSPVLGYLVSGACIGDYGLRIVSYEQTHFVGEFGIVFFLFVIGLDLSFERLKAMRKYVLGLGSLQMFITTILIGGAVSLISQNNNVAIIVGGGLALSSTAIVMQIIEENNNNSSQLGRISLAILLQQDLLVVPLLVIVPLLTTANSSIGLAIAQAFFKAIVALITIFAIGRLLLKPIFGFISSNISTSNEIFVAATLFIVLASAYLTDYVGVSMALGAFIAGILVAETEFRNAAEKSISPFKGLLLGLFFMSVGMRINIHDIWLDLYKIITFSIALILLKALIIYSLSLLFGFSHGIALNAGLLLSQGGEFGFILFKLGQDSKIIPEDIYRTLIMVITFTMAITPLLSIFAEKFAEKLDGNIKKPTKFMEFGAIDLKNHIIIAGFGKVGKMTARIFSAEGISYIGIDANEQIVAEYVAEGCPVFVGDVSQYETLKAVGADRASCLLLATDNEITIKKSLQVIAENFTELKTVVRTHDLSSANDLYDLGATEIVPEDCEIGLQLGSTVLKILDIGEYKISKMKKQFRNGNYVTATDMKDEDNDET